MFSFEIVLILYFLMWYLTFFLAICYVISGLDDLFFDVYYWSYYFIRLWRTRNFEPLTYQKLIEKEEQLIAVLTPCWQEAGVIGTMLQHNCNSIDYKKFYFFVGVYPNDPATVAEVQEVAIKHPNVVCVVGKQPGPTNKATNLNGVYQFVKEFEKERNIEFSMFVFHDAEDIIHPRSFLLYNYLIPRKEMIQIPVFPLEVPYHKFTHWLYADEFSENHTKNIIVREAIHGHVPSAGVGTAFSRHALKILEDPKTHTPFSTESLTEDYRTSLAIRMHNLKQIFVTQRIPRLVWVRRGIFRRRYVEKKVKEIVATRALFPMEYKKSVRQKSRWIIGIVFQEWLHGEWPKQWVIRYTLMHDRKPFLTHFVNGIGYFVFLFWILYALFTANHPMYPTLQEQLNMNPWVWWVIIFITILMVQRMVQRVIALARVYHWIPAILSIPRVFYENILNFHAICRAYKQFFQSFKVQETKAQPKWDKTDHHFPGSHILTPYRKRLGDILVEHGVISQEKLNQLIVEQQETGERLGSFLCRKKCITPHELIEILAMQYHLEKFPKSQLGEAQHSCEKTMPEFVFTWLTKNDITPVLFDSENKKMRLALYDPTNEYLIEKTINMVLPYKVEFLIIDTTA